MGRLLHIETATSTTSVAFSEDGHLLALSERNEKNLHASIITLLIDEVMKTAGYTYGDLQGVSVSMGPGSYTGLRIGVATAKGLCYALDIPLIGINTLEAMFEGMRNLKSAYLSTVYNSGKLDEKAILFCPMIDARRMEVYMALYDQDKKTLLDTRAEIISQESFAPYLTEHRILFFGDGAAKIKAFYQGPEAHFLEDFKNSAAHLIPLAEERFQRSDFEDTAYFEPFYLKEFMGTQAKTSNKA